MSKVRKSILIIGILVIVVAASLATALALFATGTIKTDPIELVYTVKDAEKVYDGTPLKATEYRLTSGEILAGHTARIEFVGEQTSVGVSKSDLSVKIYDDDGYNVTNNYSIKVESGDLTVTKKSISIDLPSQKAVYNGATVALTNYRVTENSAGDLVAGHKIYGSTDAGLLNVGDTVPENLTPLVFDAAGNDVTANYDIDFTVGEIEVIPRYISVRPVSVSKVYDGTELVADEIEYVEGSVADGQYVKYEINEGLKNALLDADVVETRVTQIKVFALVNGEEVEVTENYEIDVFETGLLEVTPRPLTVTAKSGSWVYDGEAHTLKNDTEALSVEGLAECDKLIDVQYGGTITDVGTAVNIISNVSLSCYSENYAIKCVNGILEVTPFEVTVTTATAEKYYDGAPLSDGRLGATLANMYHNIEIADGDYPEITEAGSITNSFECRITDRDGKPVTANYYITYEYGTLTVNKLPVTALLGKEESVEYNGEEQKPDLTDGSYFSLVSVDGEHTSALALTGEDFEVVSYSKTMTDAGEYAYSVRFADKTLSDNYLLEVPDNGYFTILPKAIALKTETDEKPYDGTALSKGEYEVTSGGLVVGHEIKLPEVLPSVTYKGQISNEFAVAVVDGFGADVTKNYKISYEYGTLEITPLGVTVTLKHEVTHVYDGKAATFAPEEVIVGIADGNGEIGENVIKKADFTVTYSEQAINVKKNGNSFLSYGYGVKITDAVFGENFTLNIVDDEGGECGIKVLPSDVSVKIKDISQVYDGQTHLLDVYSAIYSVEDLRTGLTRDDFNVKFSLGTVLKNVNNYPYTVELPKEKKDNYNVTVKNASGKDNSATYPAVYGIEKFDVTVTTASRTFIYDGTDHTCGEFTNTALACKTHSVVMVTSEKNLPFVNGVTDADSKVENELSFYVYEGIDDVSSNYNIQTVNGYLEVAPCAVTVYTPSATRVFDNQALSCQSGVTLTGAAENFTAEADEGEIPEITFVGTLSNVFKCRIFNGGDDVSENFVISYVYGTLEITPLEVKVKLNEITDTQNNDFNNSLEYDGTVKYVYGVDYALSAIVTLDEYGDETDVPATVLGESDFEIVYSAVMIDAGTYGYSVKVSDAEYAKNFVLTCEGGTVTVSKMSVTVVLKEYIGGEALTFSNTEKMFGSGDVASMKDRNGSAVAEKLLPKSALMFAVDGGLSVKYVGDYSYYAYLADKEYLKNFEVKCDNAQVTVQPLDVEVTLKDYVGGDAFTFDNTVKKIDPLDAIALDTTLLTCADFKISVNNNAVIKNFGSYAYNAMPTDFEYAKNFNLIYSGGEVTVEKLEVNVTLENYSLTYSGEEQAVKAKDAVTVDTDLLRPTDFAVVISGGKVVMDADSYTYTAELNDGLGTNEYYDNFIVNCTAGNITVNKLGVILTLASYTRVFNDATFVLDVSAAVVADTYLLEETDFIVTYTSEGMGVNEIKNAGNYAYTVRLSADSAKNFEIKRTFGDGKITVERLGVNVVLNDLTTNYSGTEYVINSNTMVKSSDTLDAQYLSVVYDKADHVNVGRYAVNVAVAAPKTASNYNLTVSGGSVTILPKPVTVVTDGASKVYDGAALKNTAVKLNDGLTGHKAEAVNTVGITDVGTVKNELICKITDLTGKDVTENYAVSYEYGTLEITPREVNVTLKNFTATEALTYNGEAQRLAFDDAVTYKLQAANGEAAVPENLLSVNDFEIVYSAALYSAGMYSYTVRYAGSNAGNFKFNGLTSANIEVRKATLSVSLGAPNTALAATYSGAAWQIELTEDNCNVGDNYDGITYTGFKVVYYSEMKNVGLYAYGAEFVNQSYLNNYILDVTDGHLQITPVDVTVTLKNYDGAEGFIYNGKQVTLNAADAIDTISGDGKDLIAKYEFSIDYKQECVKVGTYAYGVEITSAETAKNFKLNVNDGSVEILKRKIVLVMSDLIISQNAAEEGYNANFDVTNLISVSSGTPLADGDAFIVNSATAEGNSEDYTLTINAGDFRWTIDNADCYEVDLSNLTAKIVIIGSGI